MMSDPSAYPVETDCCIVGGGPAGAVLALLLARQGISVTLLEAHKDFDRDFRGDVLQPAALDLVGQMGLAERVLDVALARYPSPHASAPSEKSAFPDMARLKTPYPFMTFVPQVRFLAVIVEEARRCAEFHLVMGARVEALVRDGHGQIRGVRFRGTDGWHEVRTKLVVAADGRFSRVRSLAGLDPVRRPAAFDLLWFRLPRRETDPAPGAFVSNGGWTVLHNRGTEWQVGCTIVKGTYAQVRAEGLEAVRRSTASRVPWLSDRVNVLRDWDQVSVLAVESSRLRRWYQPGLLLIGDAAHTMSSVGAVGYYRGDPGRGGRVQSPRTPPACWARERWGPGRYPATTRVARPYRSGLPAVDGRLDAGSSRRRQRGGNAAHVPSSTTNSVPPPHRGAHFRPRRLASSTHCHACAPRAPGVIAARTGASVRVVFG